MGEDKDLTYFYDGLKWKYVAAGETLFGYVLAQWRILG